MSTKPTKTRVRRRPRALPRLFRGGRIESGEQLAGGPVGRRLGRAARGDDVPRRLVGALPAELDVVAPLDHHDRVDREHETDEQDGQGHHGPQLRATRNLHARVGDEKPAVLRLTAAVISQREDLERYAGQGTILVPVGNDRSDDYIAGL